LQKRKKLCAHALFCQAGPVRKQDARTEAIISESKTVNFDYPLMDRNSTPRMHHVYKATEDEFEVHMKFKNMVCLLGRFRNLETACRFADMATYRWRDYRRTTLKYNFSESQARIDSADDSETGGTLARHLLGRIQTILTSEGLLSHTKFVRKQPKEKKQGNANPVSARVAKLSLRLDGFEMGLGDTLAKLESRIAQLEEQMATLRLSHTELPPVYDDKTIIIDSVSKQTLPDPTTPPDAPKTIW
jgi:hypothetical protein